MPLWLSALLWIGLAAAPAATPPATAIRQVLGAQTAAWNRGDINAFMASYWRSPRTEFVGAAGVTRGWEATRTHYLASYPDRAAMGHLTFRELEIEPLCADAALVTGRFQLDRAHDQPHGYFTLLFRRFPEGWRIVSDHTSAARP